MSGTSIKAIVAVFICLFSDIYGSTERYLENHSIDDIKYSVRLFETTFEHKTLFDKAIQAETEGFFGYFAADSAFRAYQDLIRMIFEEILAQKIPPDFHFVAVPCYPKRTLHTLEDIEEAFFKNGISQYAFRGQCLPMQLALYANHKSLGFCPIRAFGKKTEYPTDDLLWLLEYLQMDKTLFDEAKTLAKEAFGENDHLLLQFFDLSHTKGLEPYSFADKVAYPATLLGYPEANASLSEYTGVDAKALPTQFFILISNKNMLNPKSPIAIKRYAKIQPSRLKSYEEALRARVRSAAYDSNQAQILQAQALKELL